jgi:pilus assembly protein FimV
MTAAGAAAAAAGAAIAAPKMDLDFHLDDDDKPAPMHTPRAPEPEPEHALAEVHEGHGGGSQSAADRLARPAATMELDKLDLSFDPDKATFEDPTPSVLDGQWHDAATKLDLAKAYQEMGDAEGAREILQEVLHEGDEQQRSEAQGLLAKLG